jgi:ATP-dependent helicase/nuclease subunit A
VDLGTVPAAASPLAERTATGDRFRRGQLLHALLQHLPDLPEADREAAAASWLERPGQGLPDGSAATLAAEAMAILAHPDLAPAFAPGSMAEVPLTGLVGGPAFADSVGGQQAGGMAGALVVGAPMVGGPMAGAQLPGAQVVGGLTAGAQVPGAQVVGGQVVGAQVVGGLVDRLAVLPDRVLVVDFKTNRLAPEHPQETPVMYLRQMAAYRAVLRGIFPGRAVQCALVWTRAARVAMLSDTLLDAHAPGASPSGNPAKAGTQPGGVPSVA